MQTVQKNAENNLGKHRTIPGTHLACGIFRLIVQKFSGIWKNSMRLLTDLTKNPTAQSARQYYAVLPLFSYFEHAILDSEMETERVSKRRKERMV